MGKVIIQEYTTKNPLQLAGLEAGVCWNASIEDPIKNYKRGLDCLESGHGRVLEYPQVYLILEGYSARVIRELYTHIGGAPTRLQASTRYIDYSKEGFGYITPPSIVRNKEAEDLWTSLMITINNNLRILEEEYNIPKEDVANGLPLGMTTTIVFRTNLRNLIDMAHQRLCSRAYWEFRRLMLDIMEALSEYSEEWAEVIKKTFVPKCEICGYCVEKRRGNCKRKPTKEEFLDIVDKKNNIEKL